MAEVSKEDYASANSILATMRTMGQSTSMAIVTIIVGLILGKGSLETAVLADLLRTLHGAFMTFVVLCAVGVFLSLQRRKK